MSEKLLVAEQDCLYRDSVVKILKNVKINNKHYRSLVSTNGYINIESSYGVQPFLDTNKETDWNVRAQGSGEGNLLMLPINYTFKYSHKNEISGNPNYFRIYLDVERLKLKSKLREDSLFDLNQKKLGELNSLRKQEIKYLYKLERSLLYLDPTSLNNTQQLLDTSFLKSNLDTIGKSKAVDIEKKVKEQKAKLNEIDSKIKMLEESIQASRTIKNPNIIRGYPQTRSFQVGLCYPSFSTLMISGVALKGVLYEGNYKKIYYAFTKGRLVDGTSARSKFEMRSFFERGLDTLLNPKSHDIKVTAVKLGFGMPDKSHLHVGVLKANESTDTELGSGNVNYVAEVDGKLFFSPSFCIYAGYGKSTVTESNDLSTILSKELLNTALNRQAFYTGSMVTIDKTKTVFNCSWTLYAPYFKSYALYTNRSDYSKVEIKLDQSLGSRLKLKVLLREDKNSLSVFESNGTLYRSAGIGTNISILKGLKLQTLLMPVRVETMGELKSSSEHLIITSNLSYTWLKRKTIYTIMGGLNRFIYQTSLTESGYENQLLSFVISDSKFFSNALSLNRFYSSSESESKEVLMVEDVVGVSASKRITATVGGKVIFSNSFNTGFVSKLEFKVSDNVKVGVGFQKFIIDSDIAFYTLDYERSDMPFMSSLSLNVKW